MFLFWSRNSLLLIDLLKDFLAIKLDRARFLVRQQIAPFESRQQTFTASHKYVHGSGKSLSFRPISKGPPDGHACQSRQLQCERVQHDSIFTSQTDPCK